jgi:hypothetical protein
MEKIKIFILTYSAPDELNNNLDSLFGSNADPLSYSVEIINNHSEHFSIRKKYAKRVTIHHQTTRANWGCGHPSRDWNQSIVKGFRDLNSPQCSQLILCQDDAVWDADWKIKLDRIHSQFSLYQCSWGDCFISMLPDAIKKIGLFDERLCTLGFYEGDFLLRALIYNKEKSSINDYHHKRVLNETEPVVRRSSDEARTPPYMDFSKTIFRSKWPGVSPIKWSRELIDNPPQGSAIPNFVFYPYFEKDIECLKEKNYIIP